MNKAQPCVYILASKKNGTLYTGVTSNLIARVYQHKNSTVEGFTKEYNIYLLVYYEFHSTMRAAITRERQIKKWKRRWKMDLIEEKNTEWKDLYGNLI